jgi:hypothetical protein
MRHPVRVLMVCCTVAAPLAFPAEPDVREVGREIGAILAWRIGPELVEERCRDIDPAGVEAREKALGTWRDKNAALIKTVDERVAEIAPLAFPSHDPAQAAAAVRAQVRKILLETISADGDASLLKAACQEDANPASKRWSNNGVSQVHNSLAALYDWKIQQEKK